MNELVVVDKTTEWSKLKALVLDSVSSPITRRVYNLRLNEFIAWYTAEPRTGFTKALVSAWRVTLETRGLGSVSINVRITAVRKLAVEAADNGLLAPELAAGIARIKGVRSQGVRVGNWLSVQQAQTLLNTPDITTKKGLRDRAMFATLLGCGLRRSEVAALTFRHIQQRDNRWCIVDLIGKHNRVRTIPMPTWVKNAVDAWSATAAVNDGHLFRPVHQGDQVCGLRISEKVIWQLLHRMQLQQVFPVSLPTTCAVAAQKCAVLPVASLSRFSRCLAILRCRLRSDTSGPSRIFPMHRTMRSS